FAIDYHNYNSLESDGHALWFGANRDSIHTMTAGLAQYLNVKLKMDYPYVDQSNNSLISLSNRQVIKRGEMNKYFEYKGIPGVIMESVVDIGGTTEDVQKFTTEALGNLILTSVRYSDYL